MHVSYIETGKLPSHRKHYTPVNPAISIGEPVIAGFTLQGLIMARMLSHLMSNILGSVGGITYLNNPFHQIVARQRTVPVQPNTVPQVRAKTSFSGAVQAWEQATEQQRLDWAAYAQTVTFQGPLGPYKPTGRMLAIAQFQITGYLLSAGAIGFMGGSVMDAPVLPGLLVITNPNIQAALPGNTGFLIAFTNNNGRPIVAFSERSFKQSDARNFYKGPWVASTLDAVVCPDQDSETMAYNDLVEDGIYFVKLRFITSGLGRRYSQEVILRATAVTTPP